MCRYFPTRHSICSRQPGCGVYQPQWRMSNWPVWDGIIHQNLEINVATKIVILADDCTGTREFSVTLTITIIGILWERWFKEEISRAWARQICILALWLPINLQLCLTLSPNILRAALLPTSFSASFQFFLTKNHCFTSPWIVSRKSVAVLASLPGSLMHPHHPRISKTTTTK